MSIHQKITFNTNIQTVFNSLTQSQLFQTFTNSPANIDIKVGGEFSCFDSIILGITLEFTPNKKLIQAWRVANWQPGEYSIVKFELEEISATQCQLIFDQTGFPEHHRHHLEQGWHNKYCPPP